MGEPLSPDRGFDFLMDEPHPAYNFFAPRPLPGYASNPNNNNGWIEADIPLLGELSKMGKPQGAEVDEPMVVPAIEEVAEPIVEAEEQMVAPVIGMEEDLAMLFGEDDNFEDDDSEGFSEEEVWEMNKEWLMAPVTPPPVPFMPSPSTYEVGGTSTAAIEGHSLALPTPGLPVPPSMIEDLNRCLIGEPQGAEVDEPMVVPAIKEVAEPMVEAEEQMIAPVIDMEEDLAALFGEDDNFEDDDSEGFSEEEVWEMNKEWLMAPVTPPPVPFMPSPSTLSRSTRMGNLEYGHGQLVKKVTQVSDAEVAHDITIGEIGPRVSATEGQIQQLQTMMAKMSSRESTLMQYIFGMDRRLAALEKKKPPGPQ
ncbi:hypothetical protein Tco_0236512 [Tanacetum coccineum]